MWPGLESARIAWAAARERIAELGATDEERRALVPVLRRKAVLDGARPQLGRDSDLKLIPLFLLWIGLPTVTMILAGRELTVSNLIRIHLLYLLFVLVVAFVVGTIALGMGTVWSEGWPNRGSVITSVLIAVTTAGLIVLFNQLRRSEAVLPGAVFAATVLVLAITLTTVAGIVRTDAKRRRAVGAQGLNHTAALVLVDEWHLLRENRPYWRRPVIRRHLLARLAALEEVVPLRIDRSVRANSDDGRARLWAESYAWRLTRSLHDHSHLLLQIDRTPQYDELIATVRRQTIELCSDSWASFEAVGDAKPRLTVKRWLGRSVVPLILVVAAFAVGYLPGIDPDSLFTIQLSLLLPALLGLLPVNKASQDAIGSALQDALGKLKT